MGDRVSISFSNNLEGLRRQSVVLFSHWGGPGLVDEAKSYARALKTEVSAKMDGGIVPLDRLDPATVMVDFIRHLTKDMERVEHDLYLGRDENDGDNSNNGHHVISLDKKP